MFGQVPNKTRTPLIPSEHPELDTTEFCGQKEIEHFQTLIGQLQWLITLGRFDIAAFVISPSSQGSMHNPGKVILRVPRGSMAISAPNLKVPSDL